MTKPDEYYAANLIPPFAWALNLYFKTGARCKESIIEVIFPAGSHKERMQKKGNHEILVWIVNRKIYMKSRCTYDKECSFNTERIDGADRDAVKTLKWEETNSRAFFKSITKWIMRYDFDFVTLIRALKTVCDRYVQIPLTTQWDKTFKNFDEYRRNRWPEDATSDNRAKFLEEVLVRVAFWFQTAVTVNALKKK